MSGFLFPAFIYLCAAVIAVPVANRLGLGSVLGYLIAGVVIGPLVGLVGAEAQDLQHFAEFGVVMMLFLVGLELEPRALWDMRGRLFGLGGLQVVGTAAVIAAVAIAIGVAWQTAVAAGLVFSLSSTAIVLQTLGEKGLARTEGGRASFSVLLFQDIAVIPMLALLPLMALPALKAAGHAGGEAAAGGAGHGSGEAGFSLVAGLPGWATGLVTLASVAIVVLAGHFLSRPLFRMIAAARLREIFTAAALLLVVGVALLMTTVGLSPALGTFLAGMILANSEFRHELESDIEPFKGLLLGLFFITVGAGIDFRVLFDSIGPVLAITLGVMATKTLILLVLGRVFRMRDGDLWLFALGLAQAGEFGFVLIGFCVQNAVMDPQLAKTLSLVVALSMLLTPALFIAYERLVMPMMPKSPDREADDITEKGAVIIAGHGRFGQVVNRLLLANGHRTVVLDHRADLIDGLRKFGVRSFYGDATRPDLLHAAGLDEAAVLVVAIDDPERALQLVEYARRERPDLHIVARANDRHAVYQLYAAGADDIIREVFDSSVRAGRSVLEALGTHPFAAERAARSFVQFDRETLLLLAEVWKPDVSVFENAEYIRRAAERNAIVESAMAGARSDLHDRTERGWTPPPRDG